MWHPENIRKKSPYSQDNIEVRSQDSWWPLQSCVHSYLSKSEDFKKQLQEDKIVRILNEFVLRTDLHQLRRE